MDVKWNEIGINGQTVSLDLVRVIRLSEECAERRRRADHRRRRMARRVARARRAVL